MYSWRYCSRLSAILCLVFSGGSLADGLSASGSSISISSIVAAIICSGPISPFRSPDVLSISAFSSAICLFISSPSSSEESEEISNRRFSCAILFLPNRPFSSLRCFLSYTLRSSTWWRLSSFFFFFFFFLCLLRSFSIAFSSIRSRSSCYSACLSVLLCLNTNESGSSLRGTSASLSVISSFPIDL